jgi:hypothetical protein
MARPDPKDRPGATEALAEFESVVSTLNRRTFRARIWRREDTFSERCSRFFRRTPLL